MADNKKPELKTKEDLGTLQTGDLVTLMFSYTSFGAPCKPYEFPAVYDGIDDIGLIFAKREEKTIIRYNFLDPLSQNVKIIDGKVSAKIFACIEFIPLGAHGYERLDDLLKQAEL